MADNRLEQVEAKEWSAQPLLDWLFSEGRLIESDPEFVLQFSRRLSSCCAPVERVLVTTLTLNPELVATSSSWLKSTDKIDYQGLKDFPVETGPVFIRAGEHRVTAAFIRQMDGPYEDLLRPNARSPPISRPCWSSR